VCSVVKWPRQNVNAIEQSIGWKNKTTGKCLQMPRYHTDKPCPKSKFSAIKHSGLTTTTSVKEQVAGVAWHAANYVGGDVAKVAAHVRCPREGNAARGSNEKSWTFMLKNVRVPQ
jgi:hypothetical protein